MHDTLARKLRVLRAERGITLREAERLTGVDKDTLSKVERGIRHPYDITLSRIARGYGVPVEELLEEESLPLAEAPETGAAEGAEKRAVVGDLSQGMRELMEREGEWVEGSYQIIESVRNVLIAHGIDEPTADAAAPDVVQTLANKVRR